MKFLCLFDEQILYYSYFELKLFPQKFYFKKDFRFFNQIYYIIF